MPPACPNCKEYDWLMTPVLAESVRDKGYKPVVCEDCGWEGTYDELEEIDAD